MAVHDAAARGFGANADVYERSRPGYPPEAVARLAELGVGPGARVVDVAAGTGKLTRLLATTGAEVVAVEPVAGMRSQLARAAPGVEVLDGTAEALPLDDASVDVVTVAQAFHWFDGPSALGEIARVLRPDGVLAVVYNRRDETIPWVRQWSVAANRLRADVPSAWTFAWREPFDGHPAFTPLEEWSCRWDQLFDHEGLVDRALSISFNAAAPVAEQEALVREIRAVARDLPERVAMPHDTLVFSCRRR